MIRLEDVGKGYRLGGRVVEVLKDISLAIAPGEFVAITGPSGSGKSTLMNIIGCLDMVDRGRYWFRGQAVDEASDDQLALIRNHHIGFVFQAFNLIPRLNALRNVELPMVYAGLPPAQRLQRARLALEAVGLGDRLEHSPAELSGGQQQRVAIARALVNNPEMIIADEPTGALDTQAASEVMALFQALNAKGKTLVMVTHEADVAAYARRHIRLRDGLVVGDDRR